MVVANSWILQQRFWWSAASWHDYRHDDNLDAMFATRTDTKKEQSWKYLYCCHLFTHPITYLQTMVQLLIVALSPQEKKNCQWICNLTSNYIALHISLHKNPRKKWKKKKGVQNRQKTRLNEKWAFIFWGNWMYVFARQPKPTPNFHGKPAICHFCTEIPPLLLGQCSCRSRNAGQFLKNDSGPTMCFDTWYENCSWALTKKNEEELQPQ